MAREGSTVAGQTLEQNSDPTAADAGVMPTLAPQQLQRLTAVIREAASGAPEVAVFVDRLAGHGVRLVPHMARNGRVTGVSYDYLGVVAKAAALGTEFTWSGLQKKLGIQYVMPRDNAVLEQCEKEGWIPRGLSSADYPAQSSLPLDITVEPAASEILALDQETADERAPTAEDAIQVSTANLSNDAESVDISHVRRFAAEMNAASDESFALPETSALEVGDAHAAESSAVDASEVARLRSELIALRNDFEEYATELPMRAGANRAVVATADLTALQAAVVELRERILDQADSVDRMRGEYWRVAITSACIAALVAALGVGLWASQKAESASRQAAQSVVDQINKQAADDPLRKYFDRIVKKLQPEGAKPN